jgi:hypothetical protein
MGCPHKGSHLGRSLRINGRTASQPTTEVAVSSTLPTSARNLAVARIPCRTADPGVSSSCPRMEGRAIYECPAGGSHNPSHRPVCTSSRIPSRAPRLLAQVGDLRGPEHGPEPSGRTGFLHAWKVAAMSA